MSARTPAALADLAERYTERLGELNGAGEWAGATASSHQGRRAFGERLAVVAGTAEQAAERLARWRASGASAGVTAGRAVSDTKLAFVFPGQGVTLAGVLRNWGLVFIGNFAGAFTVALMMSIVFTFGFTTEPDKVGQIIGNIGAARTLGYAAHGAAGMLTLFIRGMLCNWMVSTGVVGAMISTQVSGKVIAMWMPIMLFFFMTFEHSVVNMFLFPAGLMLGGKFTIMDYLIWNEIPTVLGNLVGGIAFTGLTLYATHVRTAPKRGFG